MIRREYEDYGLLKITIEVLIILTPIAALLYALAVLMTAIPISISTTIATLIILIVLFSIPFILRLVEKRDIIEKIHLLIILTYKRLKSALNTLYTYFLFTTKSTRMFRF